MKLSRTRTGDTCFPWNDHPSSSDDLWLVSKYNHNHCRNPKQPSSSLSTLESSTKTLISFNPFDALRVVVFEVFSIIPGWTNKRQTPRKGVWCFTGKGDTWNYCSVPKCEELEKSPVLGLNRKVETNMNITKIEKESYPIIVMASIVLIIADFFVFVIILTITVSWCRGKEIRKEKETNELEEL